LLLFAKDLLFVAIVAIDAAPWLRDDYGSDDIAARTMSNPTTATVETISTTAPRVGVNDEQWDLVSPEF
jgi:hypothetical protein